MIRLPFDKVLHAPSVSRAVHARLMGTDKMTFAVFSFSWAFMAMVAISLLA